MFALVKNGKFFRRIPESGKVELNKGDHVSPPVVGWNGKSGDDTFVIMVIQPFVTPEGKYRIGDPSYSVDDGKVIETYDVEDIPPEPEYVPDSITPAQAKAELFERGLLSTAETAVAEHPYELVRIYWHSALQWDRNNAYVIAYAYELGLQDQLDDFFISASKREF